MEGGSSDVLGTGRTKRGKLHYEVGSGSASEGDGQDLAGRHAVFEEACNSTHEGVRLASAGAGDDPEGTSIKARDFQVRPGEVVVPRHGALERLLDP